MSAKKGSISKKAEWERGEMQDWGFESERVTKESERMRVSESESVCVIYVRRNGWNCGRKGKMLMKRVVKVEGGGILPGTW